MGVLDFRMKTFRLKQAREKADRMRAGALPLIAFYGKGKKKERERNRFYEDMAAAFNWPMRVTDPVPVLVPKSPKLDEVKQREGRGMALFGSKELPLLRVDANAAPLEWLMLHGHLQGVEDADGIATVRFQTAINFRSILVGAEPKGLRTVNFEGSGGGSQAPTIVNDMIIDCLKLLDECRKMVPPSTFDVLELVIYKDVWLWEKKTAAGAAVIIGKLHKGLDTIAKNWGALSPDEFNRRWKPKREQA